MKQNILCTYFLSVCMKKIMSKKDVKKMSDRALGCTKNGKQNLIYLFNFIYLIKYISSIDYIKLMLFVVYRCA